MDWWQHPIFTPRGLWIFWSDLMASFWRGEVKWHGQMLRCRLVDGFYAISSLTLLVAALIGVDVIVVFVTVSEIIANRMVFASDHNWFHQSPAVPRDVPN